MRILRINMWDGPVLGGAEDYIREVMTELDSQGHENRLLNLNDVPPPNPKPGERYFRTVPRSAGGARLRQDLFLDTELLEVLRQELRDFRPDLVQLHHFQAGITTVGRFVKDLEVPVVMTAHDAGLVCPIQRLVLPDGQHCEGGIRWRCQFTGCRVGQGLPYALWSKHLFDTWVAPHVRAYQCPSRAVQDYLRAHGYEPAVHIPSFVRLPPEVEAGPSAPYPPPGGPVVGYIGRLEEYKGVEDLLRAFVTVAGRFRSSTLDIAGEGSQGEAFRRLAEDLGIAPRVRFLGRLSGRAKFDWYAGIHVLAVPSRGFENLPLVAMEAQAQGRPVVGTDVGGIPEIVQNGRTGRVVPLGDPPALATALDETLRNPDRAAQWGQAGRQRVLEEFHPRRHVRRLLDLYARVRNRESFPATADFP